MSSYITSIFSFPFSSSKNESKSNTNYEVSRPTLEEFFPFDGINKELKRFKGKVTSLNKDEGVVGNDVYFNLDICSTSLKLGDNVIGDAARVDNTSAWRALTIDLKTEDSEENDGEWNEPTLPCNAQSVVAGTFIGKVSSIYKGLVQLSNGITFYVNEEYCDFDLQAGDWISCIRSADKDTELNSAIPLVDVQPLRKKVIHGLVTHVYQDFLVINGEVLCKKSLCRNRLKMREKVKAEVIESDQKNYCWRAKWVRTDASSSLVVEKSNFPLIEDMVIRSVNGAGQLNVKKESNVETLALPETLNTLEDIVIEQPTPVFIKGCGYLVYVPISISNRSDVRTYHIVGIRIFPSSPTICPQIGLDKTLSFPIPLNANQTLKVICNCLGRKSGLTEEFVVFDLADNNSCYTTVQIQVKEDVNYPKNGSRFLQLSSNKGRIIQGEKPIHSSPFLSDRLPLAMVPETLWNVHNDVSQLEEMFPYLCEPLNMKNYVEKLSTMLHLEEISITLQMEKYNIHLASFCKHGEFLSLVIEGLAEKRPSLLVGDSVVASSPVTSDPNQVKYEGVIHEILYNKVLLKFNSRFHEEYNDEDYSIELRFNRTPLRRCHKAISYVVEQLGSSILFPSRLQLQLPQVTFVAQNDLGSFQDSSYLYSTDLRENRPLVGTLRNQPSTISPRDQSSTISPSAELFQNMLCQSNSVPLPSKQLTDYDSDMLVPNQLSNSNSSASLRDQLSSAPNTSAPLFRPSSPTSKSTLSLRNRLSSTASSRVSLRSQTSSASSPVVTLQKRMSSVPSSDLLLRNHQSRFSSSDVSLQNRQSSIPSSNASLRNQLLTACGRDWFSEKETADASKSLKTLKFIFHSNPDYKADYCIPIISKANKGNDLEIDERIPKLVWFNSCLNNEQKLAVKMILEGSSRPLPYVIYGPPGTGKTVTVVEALLQIHKMVPHSRILAVTPSNSACDILTLRAVQQADLKPGEIVRINAYNRNKDQIPKGLEPYCIVGSSGACNDLKSIARHRIVCATACTAGLLYTARLPNGHFTHIFIDEAGQLTEPETCIALGLVNSSSGQIVLAGDPKQLGPVVTSPLAKRYGLQQSFLHRLCLSVLYQPEDVSLKEIYKGENEDFLTHQIDSNDKKELKNPSTADHHEVELSKCRTEFSNLFTEKTSVLDEDHYTSKNNDTEELKYLNISKIRTECSSQFTEKAFELLNDHPARKNNGTEVFQDSKIRKYRSECSNLVTEKEYALGQDHSTSRNNVTEEFLDLKINKSRVKCSTQIIEKTSLLTDNQSSSIKNDTKERPLHNSSRTMGKMTCKKICSFEPRLVTLLVKNYRSHPALLPVPSYLFYQSKLVSAAPKELVTQLLHWSELPNPEIPLIFHAVDGENLQESNSPSWFNPAEAFQVARYIISLLDYGLSPSDIGVIAPYKKQVEKIKELLTAFGVEFSSLKISTVEDFQGQERLAVIVSTVRSSEKLIQTDVCHNLGFLRCSQRFNVAITRAIALLIVVGDPFLLSKDCNWRFFINFCVSQNTMKCCNSLTS